MGTNYYLQLKETILDKCPTALQDRKDEIIYKTRLHIDKSSYGWRFLFEEQLVNFKKINTYEKWKVLLQNPDYEIVDEVDEKVEFEFLDELILRKQNKENRRHNEYSFHYISDDGFDFSIGEFS